MGKSSKIVSLVVSLFLTLSGHSGNFSYGVHRNASGGPPQGEMKFKAEGMESKVALLWSISSQNNTDFFIIERSTDGLNWTAISKQKAAEFCSITLYYEIFDEKAPLELCFYRIKTLFLDGAEEISSMAAVDRTNKKEYLTFFPQVPYDHMSIISSSKMEFITYELRDKKGNWVELPVKEVSDNKIVFDISSIPKADYTIRLRSASGMEVRDKVYVKWGK